MSSHLTTTSHLTVLLSHLISPLHLTSLPYCVISSHHDISPHCLTVSPYLTTASHLTASLCHLISPLHLTSRPYCVISSHHSVSPHCLSVSPHLTITSRLTAWLYHLIYTYHYISPPYHAECGTSHHLTIPAAASLSVESLPKQQQQQKVHYVHMTPVCLLSPLPTEPEGRADRGEKAVGAPQRPSQLSAGVPSH